MPLAFAILMVALCAALIYALLLKRDLFDSRKREAALVLQNRDMRQKNAELTIVSAVMFAAAQRNEQENGFLRAENASHVTSLTLVLGEMEKAR